MNYHEPRELQKDGKGTGLWHYTNMNDGRIWPEGYCAGIPEWSVFPEPGDDIELPLGFHSWDQWRQDRNRLLPFRHKFHTHGHASKEEAYACFKEYCLDLRTRFIEDSEAAQQQHRCQVCQAWTSGGAEVNHQHFVLCKEHRTRETLERIFEAGDMIGSY
jgi:hypothetical protein